MRNLKLILTVLAVALCFGACKKGGEAELTGHIKMGVENFKSAIDGEANPQILDYRSADEYNAGHIPGAISMPVATSDLVEDSQYMRNIQSQFSTTKKLFIYGGTDSWGVNGNVLPGLIAEIWGKDKTILLDGGYNAWVKAGYPTE